VTIFDGQRQGASRRAFVCRAGGSAATFVSLPKEPVFVDVGANIGTSTVAALRRHGFASAVAIEPSPETFGTLRLNLAANDLEERVQALRVAVGDVEGIAGFDTSRDPGRHRLAEATAGANVSVEVVTLDALVRRGVIEPARIGLLWIDAQGHEPAVLAGAAGLVGAAVPTVVTIRQKAPWPPTLVERITAAYTHVVELRKRQDRHRRHQPIGALPDIFSRRCRGSRTSCSSACRDGDPEARRKDVAWVAARLSSPRWP
jgi:FkbM family methyltransferase